MLVFALVLAFKNRDKKPVKALSIISYRYGYLKRSGGPGFVRAFTFNCVHLEKESYTTTPLPCRWDFLHVSRN